MTHDVPRRRVRALFALGLLGPLLGAGCVGLVGDGKQDDEPGNGKQAITCDQPTLGASPLRRLTRWEYNNTVRDLLGDTTEPASGFAPEARQFGFDNNADGATFNATVIEDYERAAWDIAERAAQDLPGLLGCDPASEGEDACAEGFIDRFGRKAFRRPLSVDERDRFVAFYDDNRQAYGFEDAVKMLLAGILQSPSFLYRIELGTAVPASLGAGSLGAGSLGAGSPDAVRLTPWETATRLAYLLWGTTPDDDLLAAAEAGALDTPEQVAAQARLMLEGEKGTRAVTNFYAQWAHLHEVQNLQKQDPAFTSDIALLMQQETEAFVDHLMRDGDGTVKSLLSSPTSFMNAELASYYGVEGVEGTDFQQVDLDPERASGIMTQGAMMARLSHPEMVSAGQFVLEKLLCAPPPPPPNDVDATLPGFDPNATSREQLEQKTSAPKCSACHSLMNPIGFAFGHYDQLGRWQDDEHGLTIDTSATVTGTDVAGDYADHRALLVAISESHQMAECMSVDWFRYAFGRDAADEDVCTLEPAIQRFDESGGDIRGLLLALTESPAFLYRRRFDTEQGGDL